MLDENKMRGPEPKAEEVSAVATADLAMDGDVLVQKFIVNRADGTSEPEYRPIPSLSK